MKEGGERKMTSGSKNRKRHDLIEMHPLRLESPETKVRERKSKKNKRGGGIIKKIENKKSKKNKSKTKNKRKIKNKNMNKDNSKNKV